MERARIILLAAEEKQTQEIAKELNIRKARVSKWRVRFTQNGIGGLGDAPRSGAPQKYDDTTEHRILAVLDEPPPEGYSTWNGILIAEHLGDVSEHHVWRVLRRNGIQLQRRRPPRRGVSVPTPSLAQRLQTL